MTIHLGEADVAGLVDMTIALEAIEAVHRAHARGELIDMPRQRVRTGSSMLHMLMAGWPGRGLMGYKAYTSSAEGNRFWLHLFDSRDGRPLAVIEANLLGMLRTGAASGLATRLLARPDATRAGIIGAGWQAEGQMRALIAVRQIESFKVFARDAAKLGRFCTRMQAVLDVPVEAVASAREAVEGADVLVTATSSPRPVLEGAWLSPGVHVNAVGSNALTRRELDDAAVMRAALVCVDSRASALNEAGDLLSVLDKGRLRSGQLRELGELLEGQRTGRSAADQVTLFESQGMAIQDLALGAVVLERAKASGLGATLPY